MIRHVADDLYQVGESAVGESGWCEAVRVYVLLNGSHPLLFDAGSHIHRETVMADLKELLGDTKPTHVFLTHTELPHTGNLRTIVDVWPDIKFVVSSAILPHVEMPWWVVQDQVQFAYPGTQETYANREISFLDGILKDQPGTHWMFDERTKTLFTADAFGYLYPENADGKFDDELEDGLPVEWFRLYHKSAFRFLPLVLGTRVNADLIRVFEKRKINVIAPTHGNAIRGDARLHYERALRAIGEICK